jgi:hypothetical protein
LIGEARGFFSSIQTKGINVSKIMLREADDKDYKPTREKGANAGLPPSRDISKQIEKVANQRKNPSR